MRKTAAFLLVINISFAASAYALNEPAENKAEKTSEEQIEKTAEEIEEARKDPIIYSIKFEAAENTKLDGKLDDFLKELAKSLNPKEKAPTSVAILRQKSRKDLDEYLAAIHSFGYYDATITLKMDRPEKNEQGKEEKEAHAIYIIDAGEKYKISTKHVNYVEGSTTGLKLPDLATLTPREADYGTANEFIDGAKELKKYIGSNNCIMTLEVTPSLDLDRNSKTAGIVYDVNAGPVANFGSVTISGNETVKESYIRNLLPVKQGDCFSTTNVEKTRSNILNSNLFATAEITYADKPQENGEVPLTLTVKERFQRTIKTGVSYMTDQGPGVSAGWEHRNFFGGGEKLQVSGLISQYMYSLSGNYTEPFFMRSDQSLKLMGKIAHEELEAYTSSNIDVNGGIERKLQKELLAGLGVGYRLSEVTEESTNNTETYALIYVPAYLQWDSRNDILNPTKGIFGRLDVAPYFDTLLSGAYFIRSKAVGSTYFAFDAPLEPILAFRGALGSITATDTESVPADLRFYAGGGSSVRGYGYEELGPKKNGDPYGGRSLIELSTELRFKATETIGGVIFVDAGNSFDAIYPDFKQDLQLGAGLGFRYYTDFGPVRLDVAVPVNSRPEDDAFQLYISLGQAF